MHRCEWEYLAGRDALIKTTDGSLGVRGPLERMCKICGTCSLWSGLDKKWINVGKLEDHYPEAAKEYERSTNNFK